ncbi:DNA-3-methyladenine glycosylase I [Xylanibacillus composti]|uniref:DNA-3-methyladenine glycosylase I n=1 Tax=Xylanibacillus composti TaxID=1572762 RepID=A0A8J4M0H9_9BACL|nr:DNA-3-methyladenine glycosylase I [Xylanibacillus composti]MDT9723964.1 DNA-3-methyladenine glycosylase I [Xylanibacillus composti]GIQ67845.1 DNA-3-methyladenine glycosylase I [Xylanibacillus composti]
MSQTSAGPDGRPRCRWCLETPEMIAYHDAEWGFPVNDDQRLFEKLCLESFQSGLSWRTILAKRDHFRKAFDAFALDKVAGYTEQDIERLLRDEGIVRHRGKIEAAINNARRALELVECEGSLAAFFWRYEPDAKPRTASVSALAGSAKEQLSEPLSISVTAESAKEQLSEPLSISVSAESARLSKDLKKLGWTFVGPTTLYSFMQAMGLVNDHAEGCVIRADAERARGLFQRPVR